MDVFGPEWQDHHLKIARNWRDVVGADDIVAIAGDVSWAMRPPEAEPDLRFIGDLPGRKVLIKGNHDYWCESKSKVDRILPDSVSYIYNSAAVIGGIGFAGTRGWLCRASDDFDEAKDGKHLRHEDLRLKTSLDALKQLEFRAAMIIMHFPPSPEQMTCISTICEKCDAVHCAYGHLHGDDCRNGFNGKIEGVTYSLVSADFVNFMPRLIMAE